MLLEILHFQQCFYVIRPFVQLKKCQKIILGKTIYPTESQSKARTITPWIIVLCRPRFNQSNYEKSSRYQLPYDEIFWHIDR